MVYVVQYVRIEARQLHNYITSVERSPTTGFVRYTEQKQVATYLRTYILAIYIVLHMQKVANLYTSTYDKFTKLLYITILCT